MVWEEKTKKVKIFRDFQVFVLSPISKTYPIPYTTKMP